MPSAYFHPMQWLLGAVVGRLQATRLQVLDMYSLVVALCAGAAWCRQ